MALTRYLPLRRVYKSWSQWLCNHPITVFPITTTWSCLMVSPPFPMITPALLPGIITSMVWVLFCTSRGRSWPLHMSWVISSFALLEKQKNSVECHTSDLYDQSKSHSSSASTNMMDSLLPERVHSLSGSPKLSGSGRMGDQLDIVAVRNFRK